jgi:hypothetical protein
MGKKIVTSSEIGQVGGGGGTTNSLLHSQKLLDAEGYVDMGIVRVEEPIPTLLLFLKFLSQAVIHLFQHIQVKLMIYSLS